MAPRPAVFDRPHLRKGCAEYINLEQTPAGVQAHKHTQVCMQPVRPLSTLAGGRSSIFRLCAWFSITNTQQIQACVGRGTQQIEAFVDLPPTTTRLTDTATPF
jgi:hypothetical protein